MILEWLRRRDAAVLAVVVTVIGGLVVLASVNLDRLPFVNSRAEYRAEFANAAGLAKGDDVRVAGVTVGKVTSIKVVGGHVEVGFEADDDVPLASQSRASVELATILGSLYVQIESSGTGRLAEGGAIPLSRTSVPFTLIDALNATGATAVATDLPSLRTSLRTLASTLGGIDPSDVKATLEGITRVSDALASRQGAITKLLSDTSTVLATLSAKRDSLVRLMADSATFTRMLHDRREVINSLLRNTSALSQQVSTLISQNGAKLGSALREIDAVAGTLAKDSTRLTAAITQLGRFSTNITNVTGSGPFIDVLLPAFLEPDNVIAACGKNPTPGCGRK